MEVILITPTPKYETLVSATKTIQSSSVDILPIIQTQVFLNHHYTLSLFVLNNNFPYQFHYPLKISKYLLDRNEGPVQLTISNGFHFKIQSDTDTLQILSNLQNSLQGAEKDKQNERNVIFLLKWWQITIRLVVVNEVRQFGKVKEVIEDLKSKWSTNTIKKGSNPKLQSQVSKLIIYIDQNNYDDFLSWSDAQTDLYTYQKNQHLSKQYLSLKQQIDNEKVLFRNKLKMVETILGENINVDKLLSEQKQQNQQYKRLRETFETIKNIDNVLIEQQKKLQAKKKQLKQKIEQKNRVRYENAKIYVGYKNEIAAVKKQLGLMLYKLQCVKKDKLEFQSKRSFQVSDKIKNILNEEARKCKQIVKNMNKIYANKPVGKNQQLLKQQNPLHFKTTQSLHRSQKKQLEKYHTLLKSRVSQSQKQAQNGRSFNIDKQKLANQMSKYEMILRSMAQLYARNHKILYQINDKTMKSKNFGGSTRYTVSNVKLATNITKSSLCNLNFTYNNNQSEQKTKSNICKSQYLSHNQASTKIAEFSLLVGEVKWPEQQFVVLNELLTQKSQYLNYLNKDKAHKNDEQESGNNKIVSNISIGNVSQKYLDQENRNANRSKSRSRISRGSLGSRCSQNDMQKKYKNGIISENNTQGLLVKSRSKLVKKTVIKAPSQIEKKTISPKS